MLFAQTEKTSELFSSGSGFSPDGIALFAIISSAIILVALVLSIPFIIGYWKVFTKAGRPGWAVLIPFYNLYVQLQITGKPAWWLAVYMVLAFSNVIPWPQEIESFTWVLNLLATVGLLILGILIAIATGKVFGKDTLWSVILLGLIPVGYLILGFGKAVYTPPQTMRSSTNPPQVLPQ
jgi:hypothetical protein